MALLVRASARAIQDGPHSYSIEMSTGEVVTAVLFSEVYRRNERRNKMAPVPRYASWTANRNGRPQILFELRPSQAFNDRMSQATAERRSAEATFEPWFDINGRVLLNPELKPLRFFAHLPAFFSTEVEGWFLEALFRMDPMVRHEDIIDRMPSANDAWQPSTRTLHQRRARARHTMRITNWQPNVRADDVWERVIEDDLDNWALTHNSTAQLTDLTVAQRVLYEAIAEDPRPSPNRNKEVVLRKLRQTLNRAQGAGYQNNHDFIISIRQRIADWEAMN